MGAIEYDDSDYTVRHYLSRGSHDFYSPGQNDSGNTVLRCRTCGLETIWPVFRGKPTQSWIDAVTSDCNPRIDEADNAR